MTPGEPSSAALDWTGDVASGKPHRSAPAATPHSPLRSSSTIEAALRQHLVRIVSTPTSGRQLHLVQVVPPFRKPAAPAAGAQNGLMAVPLPTGRGSPGPSSILPPSTLRLKQKPQPEPLSAAHPTTPCPPRHYCKAPPRDAPKAPAPSPKGRLPRRVASASGTPQARVFASARP